MPRTKCVASIVTAFIIDGFIGYFGGSIYIHHHDPWGLFFAGCGLGLFVKNIEREWLRGGE